ncbi:MAG: dienelactone hydrolase family protein [Ilumatobacteraceae bacterium]
MTDRKLTPGPSGDLETFTVAPFSHDGATHDVYRKGEGPAVIVITEMPGITPLVLGFADRIVALGCTAVLPDLFGTAGRDPMAGGKIETTMSGVRTMLGACISREFTVLATGRTSRVIGWLRALAALEHEQCGGPGVGVVGMCFTGGFALAMAVDRRVIAPVLSQPSLPLPISESRRRNIDCSPAELDIVAGRCAAEGLRVLGLRFEGDPFVPPERFAFLSKRLGDAFVAVEIDQADGNPNGPLAKCHSVLTGDLIDEPGEPTRDALEQVLALFRDKLVEQPPTVP